MLAKKQVFIAYPSESPSSFQKPHSTCDMTPTSPNAPSSPISSASPLKDPIIRSTMKKIQKGLSLDAHKFNGLLTLFTWAKKITKT